VTLGLGGERPRNELNSEESSDCMGILPKGRKGREIHLFGYRKGIKKIRNGVDSAAKVGKGRRTW